MLRLPITHDETLESQLALQQAVQGLGVLASIRVVDLLVGTHNGTHSGSDRVGEWPEIELMHSLVVNI